jgi:hypothetical protein
LLATLWAILGVLSAILLILICFIGMVCKKKISEYSTYFPACLVVCVDRTELEQTNAAIDGARTLSPKLKVKHNKPPKVRKNLLSFLYPVGTRLKNWLKMINKNIKNVTVLG